MSEYPNEYDRIFLLEKTIPYIKDAALRYLKILGWGLNSWIVR